MRIGALEAGGTKMVCAVGKEDGTILERVSYPTKEPENTIPQMIEYFREQKIEALGIGTFGPADLDKHSSTYGYITSTPKLSWTNFDLLGSFQRELSVPTGFDTDVNASAIGEATYGITRGLDSSIYITVGTGVGVGICINGKAIHGMMHPEAGHILLPKHPEDTYQGKCPFHPNCLEGLAAGPAIEERWGKKAYELTERKEVWELEAYYLAVALVNYTMILSPRRIVLGGGVMHQKQLFPLIRAKYKELLNGYIKTKEIEQIDSYIVPPSLNDNQGIMGCIRIALDAMEEK